MECKHNLHYWNLEPYLAFGPSAHGYDGYKRYWNTPSLQTYLEKLKGNKSPVLETEILSKTDHYNEAVFNGLRTRNGIPLQKINAYDTNHSYKKWGDLLEIKKDRIFLKMNQYKYADAIASDLMILDE